MKFSWVRNVTLMPGLRALTYLAYKVAKRVTSTYAGAFDPANADRGIFYTANRLLMNEFGLAETIRKKASIDAEGNAVPWYTYPAIEFLKQLDLSRKSVFEFGSGNSTLWWAAHARTVRSVEHDPAWYEGMVPRIPGNVKLLLETDGEKYAGTLDAEYDVIVIDAEWRDKCAAQALKHISDAGMIIVDDAQRVQNFSEYRRALGALQSDPRFMEIDFPGFTPITTYTKITSIFISRQADLKRSSAVYPEFCIGNLRDEHE
ncbi:MAG: SAM-dependent methyltransferase [Lentisphaeria bacterium]|nr:SAM-dependent methyltransferase [Lentisphaeria bacterium]